MKIRLARWTPGEPPSLMIEAETPDEVMILSAVTDERNMHDIAITGSSWSCDKHGCIAVNLGWRYKPDRIPIKSEVVA